MYDPNEPTESPGEAIGTGLLMLALICGLILLMAAFSP